MSQNDDILFDRLVDGELSARERRQLLATLDDRPDGWRRCALAFLEAQAWGQELGGLAAEAARPSRSAGAGQSSLAGSIATPRRRASWLALAASVLMAFTLGLALRDLPHPHQIAAPSPSSLRVDQIAAAAPERTEPRAEAASPTDALTLWVRDDAGQPRPLRVPLVDATALDQRTGLRFQSGLSPQERQQLEQLGYEVESRQRYAPLWLENGRPLVVPVEDMKIVPVSNRVY